MNSCDGEVPTGGFEAVELAPSWHLQAGGGREQAREERKRGKGRRGEEAGM